MVYGFSNSSPSARRPTKVIPRKNQIILESNAAKMPSDIEIDKLITKIKSDIENDKK